MFLLLSGCGVGYSVQTHHIEKLPEIRKPLKSKRYLVGDSIEGWSDAVRMLIKSYFGMISDAPNFDFRDIRPKGAQLITVGGKAPGPEPLKIALIHVQAILDRKKDGEKLTSLECHDIICHLADAVLSGGIRRAALISLFNLDDEEMLTCKFGAWWETNPQRGRSNNSAVLLRNKIDKETFLELWKKIEASNSGEQGFIFTNDKDAGTNPCAEINLKANQFCNLCEFDLNFQLIHCFQALNLILIYNEVGLLFLNAMCFLLVELKKKFSCNLNLKSIGNLNHQKLAIDLVLKLIRFPISLIYIDFHHSH